MRFLSLFIFFAFYFANGQALDSGLVLCIPIQNNVKEAVFNRTIISFGYTLTNDRNGVPNQAIKFNGTTNYIEVDSFGFWLPEKEITISFWAKTEEVKSHFVCVMMPNNPNNRLSIVINYNHSGLKYHFWDVQNTGDGRLGVTPIYEDNNWHHYTFTNSYTSGEMRAYKDGILLERKYTYVSTKQGNRNLRIGKGDVPGSNFHGSIDEFRIYNRVLSQQEVTLLQKDFGCETIQDTTDTTTPTDTSNGLKPCNASQYYISPNPAFTSFTISGYPACNAQGTASLYNAIGQFIDKQYFKENKANFQTTGLASGTYFVRIETENGIFVRSYKVIIGLQ
ncbi:MAG: hypothetical protein RLZZ337_719 [Bacteroidota bacterium]|jgi:hypothetical protein